MKKPIPKEKKSALYDWMPTNSCLGIVVHAEHNTRNRSLDLLQSKSIFWIRIQDDQIDAVVRGTEEDYLLRIDFADSSFGDFVGGAMTCECESFMYRDGPCKHIVAVALESIVRREGGEYMGWVRSVCSEARNSGDQYMPWEKKPVISEEHAKEHGVEIETFKRHRKEILCYRLENGMRWTGSLPLPEKGEKVMTKLATGDEVEATILRPFEEDENDMLGFWVLLSETPEYYKSEEVVLYGSEIRRQE